MMNAYDNIENDYRGKKEQGIYSIPPEFDKLYYRVMEDAKKRKRRKRFMKWMGFVLAIIAVIVIVIFVVL